MRNYLLVPNCFWILFHLRQQCAARAAHKGALKYHGLLQVLSLLGKGNGEGCPMAWVWAGLVLRLAWKEEWHCPLSSKQKTWSLGTWILRLATCRSRPKNSALIVAFLYKCLDGLHLLICECVSGNIWFLVLTRGETVAGKEPVETKPFWADFNIFAS